MDTSRGHNVPADPKAKGDSVSREMPLHVAGDTYTPPTSAGKEKFAKLCLC